MEGVVIAAFVTQSTVVSDYIKKSVEGLQKGNLLSSELRQVPIFPNMMVSILELVRNLVHSKKCLKTADYYDEELEAALTKLMGLIEPVMIVVMAIMIGFLVIAMLMPMFDMVSVVGK